MEKITKSTINRLAKLDKPNVVIHMRGLKCNIDVDEDSYSPEDTKEIKRIINAMSKNIWIDRTYVAFKGNRWKDAFIVEERWYELIKLILTTDFGRKCSKDTENEIMTALMVMAITYLYSVIEHYGYDSESIMITLKKNMKFKAEYMEDRRTSWNF